MFLHVLNCFDMLMLKIILKNKKIIDIYFNMKSYFKNTRNHTVKHTLTRCIKLE